MELQLFVALFPTAVMAIVTVPAGPLGSAPPLPPLAPAYMVVNVNNQYGVAPDKGILRGPVIAPINSSLSRAL
ncbi:hypothetical protein VTN77DRAFT_3001 [Rasamsonia byssochlamydoides]|uniref:uncharacterized protein n=1 Tax=Rasamsonia byssochlamydoides TaxID=89139 RepID=UPI003743A324